ncbi:MAG: N-acetylmuramoyl-L-alanine amidase [Verrucomicrobia bacterium]|nr:N-acetylmuramoyl-L-alanine amidase [Verrucomicrobiota bacterium]
MSRGFLHRFVRLGLLAVTLLVAGAEHREASPRAGEGVYGLLRRHGFKPTPDDLSRFQQLNEGRLGPDRSLVLGRRYRLPPSPEATPPPEGAGRTRLYYPIFGPKREWVDRRDNQLAGAVFYLVSGHGGPDPGALGQRDGHTLAEDEYAYDITLRLARVLLEHGAQVFMIIKDPDDGIRDGQWLPLDRDEVTHPEQPIPAQQVPRLRQRAAAVNALYDRREEGTAYHRVIILHLDSRSLEDRVDVFFYHHQSSALGRRLAVNLRDAFAANYRKHQPSRGYRGTVDSRSLYMLNVTTPPAVFIELGNIRNRSNQYRFIQASNRQALAEWIRDGIVQDFHAAGGG